MTIYQTYAAKYYELGFQPIPTFGKRVFLKGWTEFCKRRMTEEEMHQIEGLDQDGGGAIGNAGVGLAMGIRCFAFDIDCDDEGLLTLVPPSPMSKRGSKGITRLYRFKGSVAPRSLNSNQFPIELLSVGRQTVVPPSRHPDTLEPYRWDNGSELVSVDELPEVDAMMLWNLLESYCKDKMILRPVKDMPSREDSVDTGKWDMGRNNYLTKWVYGRVVHMELDGRTVDDVVTDLLDEDKRAHGSRAWFADPEEGRGTPTERAKAMVMRAIQSAKDRGDYYDDSAITVELTELPVIDQPLKTVKSESAVSKKINDSEIQELLNEVPWLRLWSKFVERQSFKYSPVLTLGAGLGMLSAMAGNLYAIDQVRSNLYVLNVAPTGEGKDAPQACLKRIMMALRSEHQVNVPSVEAYKSSAVIMRGFDKHHRRIKFDIQDEVGKLFEHVNDAKSAVSGTVENMCQLFTVSKSIMNRQDAMDKSRAIEAVANPCMSWLGSTTPVGARQSVSGESASRGFPARCLFMIQDRREWPDDHFVELETDVNIPPALLDITAKFLKQPPQLTDEALVDINMASLERSIRCEQVPKDDKFDESIREFATATNKWIRLSGRDDGDIVFDMVTRRVEMLKKLCLCWYVGHDGKFPMSSSTVRWAAAILGHSLAKVTGYVETESEPMIIKISREIAKTVTTPIRADKLKEKGMRAIKKYMHREPNSQEVNWLLTVLITEHLREVGQDQNHRKLYARDVPENE